MSRCPHKNHMELPPPGLRWFCFDCDQQLVGFPGADNGWSLVRPLAPPGALSIVDAGNVSVVSQSSSEGE